MKQLALGFDDVLAEADFIIHNPAPIDATSSWVVQSYGTTVRRRVVVAAVLFRSPTSRLMVLVLLVVVAAVGISILRYCIFSHTTVHGLHDLLVT
jgi:hypothetical protein